MSLDNIYEGLQRFQFTQVDLIDNAPEEVQDLIMRLLASNDALIVQRDSFVEELEERDVARAELRKMVLQS